MELGGGCGYKLKQTETNLSNKNAPGSTVWDSGCVNAGHGFES